MKLMSSRFYSNCVINLFFLNTSLLSAINQLSRVYTGLGNIISWLIFSPVNYFTDSFTPNDGLHKYADSSGERIIINFFTYPFKSIELIVAKTSVYTNYIPQEGIIFQNVEFTMDTRILYISFTRI